MRAVNLLPLDAYAPKERLPYARLVLAGTAPVLAGALVYLGYSVEHSKVADRQIVLSAAQSQIASAGPSPELALQAGVVSGERSAREAELADALSKEIQWDVIFGQISRVIPANVWLTSLNAQSPTPASSIVAVSGAGPVTIQGETESLADVATVLTRLALIPSLTNVALTSAGTAPATAAGSKSLVQFGITASVRGAGS